MYHLSTGRPGALAEGLEEDHQSGNQWRRWQHLQSSLIYGEPAPHVTAYDTPLSIILHLLAILLVLHLHALCLIWLQLCLHSWPAEGFLGWTSLSASSCWEVRDLA